MLTPVLNRRSLLKIAVPALISISAAAGCGPRLIDVTGQVVIDGKPAPPGLKVVFEPRGGTAEPILSATDTAGRYRLIDRSGKAGVAPGPYVVSIGFWGEASASPPELASLKIPEQYLVGSSTLECLVGHTSTVFDIDITTK